MDGPVGLTRKGMQGELTNTWPTPVLTVGNLYVKAFSRFKYVATRCCFPGCLGANPCVEPSEYASLSFFVSHICASLYVVSVQVLR